MPMPIIKYDQIQIQYLVAHHKADLIMYKTDVKISLTKNMVMYTGGKLSRINPI